MVTAGLHVTGAGLLADRPDAGGAPRYDRDPDAGRALQHRLCRVEFNGVTGKTIAISTTGAASLTPLFVLCA